jgi:hypothetical protein
LASQKLSGLRHLRKVWTSRVWAKLGQAGIAQISQEWCRGPLHHALISPSDSSSQTFCPSDSSSQTFCPSNNLNHEHSATEKYLQSTDSSSRRISRWTNCQTKFHQPLNTWFVTIRPAVTFRHLKYTLRPSDVSCSYATYVCISSLDILSIKSLRWTNCHSGLILSISSSIGCHSWGCPVALLPRTVGPKGSVR